MNVLDLRLNDILNNWRSYYDVQDSVAMKFSVDKDGFLLINETKLIPTACLAVLSADTSVDSIVFQIGRQRYLRLRIQWPEDGIPYVSAISSPGTPVIYFNQFKEGTT